VGQGKRLQSRSSLWSSQHFSPTDTKLSTVTCYMFIPKHSFDWLLTLPKDISTTAQVHRWNSVYNPLSLIPFDTKKLMFSPVKTPGTCLHEVGETGSFCNRHGKILQLQTNSTYFIINPWYGVDKVYIHGTTIPPPPPPHTHEEPIDFPKMTKISFVSSCTTGSLSRKAQLHEVSYFRLRLIFQFFKKWQRGNWGITSVKVFKFIVSNHSFLFFWRVILKCCQ
jgi:hypothetical protein